MECILEGYSGIRMARGNASKSLVLDSFFLFSVHETVHGTVLLCLPK